MSERGHDPLHGLLEEGQSVWLDFISRDLVRGGGLRGFVDAGVRGETSNPSIFEKAIGSGDAYDAQLRKLTGQGLPADVIFDRLAIDDVRAACDVFAPLYAASNGGDGFVSIEVAPQYADDTGASLAEARRLWTAVARPNVMVKIPGTHAGIPAIRQSLAEGININITLLFSLAHYEAVVEAFLEALEERLRRGATISALASVASFFVSRVDTVCDELLDQRLAAAGDKADRLRLAGLKGRSGVANAQQVYARFTELFESPRWRRLAAAGAGAQRVLWASTGTKNPAYSDVLYVEELIGPDTINTMPEQTLAAFREHGVVRRTVDADPARTHRELAALAVAGIDLRRVGEDLQEQGVAQFAEAFGGVVRTVDEKRGRFAAAA